MPTRFANETLIWLLLLLGQAGCATNSKPCLTTAVEEETPASPELLESPKPSEPSSTLSAKVPDYLKKLNGKISDLQKRIASSPARSQAGNSATANAPSGSP